MGVTVPEALSVMQEGKPAIILGQTLLQGRPDLPSIISEVIRNSGRDEKIVVAACGPESLVNLTRNSTAACVNMGGPLVVLHIEQFGL
jgi:hypothetical protein